MGNRDPWAHRSVGMKCKTCMWYVAKSELLGRCRKHAPTMNGYPAVTPKDWCGDHKLDEVWAVYESSKPKVMTATEVADSVISGCQCTSPIDLRKETGCVKGS